MIHHSNPDEFYDNQPDYVPQPEQPTIEKTPQNRRKAVDVERLGDEQGKNLNLPANKGALKLNWVTVQPHTHTVAGTLANVNTEQLGNVQVGAAPLIGFILLSDDKAMMHTALTMGVVARDFQIEAQAYAFAAIKQLVEASQPVTLETVAKLMTQARGEGGLAYGGTYESVKAILQHLMDGLPEKSAGAEYYCNQIIEGRQALLALSEIRKAEQALLNGVQPVKVMSDLRQGLVVAEGRTATISNTVAALNNQYFAHLRDVFTGKAPKPVYFPNYTGLEPLSDMVEGFRAKRSVAIGAASGSGKSTIVMQIAYEMSRLGMPTIIFLLETEKEKAIAKYIAMLSGVTGKMLYSEKDPQKVAEYSNRMRGAANALNMGQLYIVGKNDLPVLTPMAIRAKIEQIAATENIIPFMAVVDYLDLLETPKGLGARDRFEGMKQNATALVGLAESLAMSVVLTLQVKETPQFPRLSDAYGADTVAQPLEDVVFGWRASRANPTDKDAEQRTELRLVKNRNADACDDPVYLRRSEINGTLIGERK